jgi:hypothetical protein
LPTTQELDGRGKAETTNGHDRAVNLATKNTQGTTKMLHTPIKEWSLVIETPLSAMTNSQFSICNFQSDFPSQGWLPCPTAGKFAAK